VPPEPDPPILPREDSRWERLRSGVDPEVNLRDRLHGDLIGGPSGTPSDRWTSEPARLRFRRLDVIRRVFD
jgi:hypothetical protein